MKQEKESPQQHRVRRRAFCEHTHTECNLTILSLAISFRSCCARAHLFWDVGSRSQCIIGTMIPHPFISSFMIVYFLLYRCTFKCLCVDIWVLIGWLVYLLAPIISLNRLVSTVKLIHVFYFTILLVLSPRLQEKPKWTAHICHLI